MVDDLLTYVTEQGPSPRWPTDVGEVIGRFHNACATPSSTFVAPVSVAGDLGPLVDHYRGLLGQVSSLDEQMRTAIEPWASRFADAVDVLDRARDVTVLPIHGDLHAGQLLRWSEGIAVSDFDGNPLLPVEYRAEPGPAAFDLANLLRSIDHVSHVVARRAREAGNEAAADRALEWSGEARAELRDAYLRVVDRRLVDLELVAAFVSLSPLHEAVYASTYLPRWRYVPLGVLTRGW
jgi:maltokinase